MSVRLFTGAAAVAALTLTLTACGGDDPAPGPSPQTTTVSIPAGASTLTATAFGANPLTVSAGTTVRWVNNDNTPHDATANSGTFASGPISPNGQFQFTFASTGNFPYRCTIHPNMVGTVVVQ
jgi:plastocyanin